MYPETVRAGERWLDASSGRGGVHAAVLRAADGGGFTRGSDWCPGLENNNTSAHAPAGPLSTDAQAAASPLQSQGGGPVLHRAAAADALQPSEGPGSSAANVDRDAGASSTRLGLLHYSLVHCSWICGAWTACSGLLTCELRALPSQGGAQRPPAGARKGQGGP